MVEFSGSEFAEQLTWFDSQRKLLKHDEDKLWTCNTSPILDLIIKLKTVRLLTCSAMDSQTMPWARWTLPSFLLNFLTFPHGFWRVSEDVLIFVWSGNFSASAFCNGPVGLLLWLLRRHELVPWTQWCYIMKSLSLKDLYRRLPRITWYTSKYLYGHTDTCPIDSGNWFELLADDLDIV